MKNSRKRNHQRGAALLMAICGLVLVTAVAIAMLFASDTETTISVNYRDKQVAIYAALSGLQEARDRIHPCGGDLGKGTGGNCTSGGLNVVPTAVPSVGAANILYIVNPGSGESASDIKPWDPTNKYFDTELCQENILGLTGTPGAPCPATSASVPSGGAWYRVYDNSDHSTSWRLQDAAGHPVPLMYKWVRVQLKTDGSTPVPITVNAAATGKQACWDGSHQQPLQTGSHADCTPPGDAVTHITVLNGGSGYTLGSSPTVTITGGTGSGATATAEVGQLPSGVTSVTKVDGGSGYISIPNVQIIPSDGNGYGASVTAVVGEGGSPVTSVAVQNGTPPACYPTGTTAASFSVAFNPPGATGAVTGMTGSTCIYNIAGTGRCGDSTVNVSGPGGFTGTMTFGGSHNDYTSSKVTNPGNYASMPAPTALTFTCSDPGSGANTPKVTSITPGVHIATVTGSGGNYFAAPTVQFTGPSPVGGSTSGVAALGASAGAGKVTGFVNLSPGAGYTANPTVVIDPPPAGAGNTTATATASIDPDVGILGITVTSGGSGYTPSNPPIVTVAPPPGAGNTAMAKATVGSGGVYQGAIYLLTSMAQTQTGARAMAQMEVGVTYQQFNMNLPAPVTLAGPNPQFGTPNSNPFKVIGTDCPTCGASRGSACDTDPYPAKPAIGVFDDPNNPTNPTSVKIVTDALGKPNNYIGVHASPDVENIFAALGDPTAAGIEGSMQVLKGIAQSQYTLYPSNPSGIYLGTPSNPVIDFVDGDYTMGPTTGYGILVVTGTLYFHGNYSWNGVIFVVGDGASIMDGGGNGQIVGSVFVANTSGGTLNAPSANWSGGGGNGVQYNHCWADDLLKDIPYIPTASPNALKVISIRTLEY